MQVKTRYLLLALMILLVVGVIAGSCARRLIDEEPLGIWTPAPVSGAPLEATRPAEILPPLAPATQDRPATPPAQPAVVPSLTPEPTAGPGIEPSPDPRLVIITERDVLQAITSGMAAQEGVSVEGAEVAFTDGKMIFGATRLAYGAIEVRNLLIVGRLVTDRGRLRLETESISPRGLVTALIPTLANQALAQYTSQWTIEEVRTLDGRLELRVR